VLAQNAHCQPLEVAWSWFGNLTKARRSKAKKSAFEKWADFFESYGLVLMTSPRL
jgi:hypothetical protein